MLTLLIPQSDVLAQTQTLQSRAESEDTSRNVVHLEEAIDRDPDQPSAHYALASLLVAQGRELGRAEEAVEALLNIAPDNPSYLALRLRLMRAFPGDAPPALRTARRLDLARRILALDSTSAVAHTEVGAQEATKYFAWHRALRPALFAEDWEVYLGVKERKVVEEGGVQFEDGRIVMKDFEFESQRTIADFYARDRFDVERLRRRGVSFIDASGPAQEAYPKAVHHLRRALQSDPTSHDALAVLARLYAAAEEWESLRSVAESLRSVQSENSFPLLASGLAHYRLGDTEGAAAAFDAALAADSTVRAAFSDLALVLPPEEVEAYRRDPERTAARYWRLHDPRLLTDVNERRVEHYARLAYADLLFSVHTLDRRGWETDRGRLFVRYGPPHTVYVFPFAFYPGKTGGGRTEVWEYDGFRFAFEDAWGLNEFTLFSPPAYAFANPHADLSAQDFVTRARERVREEPERSQYAPERRVSIPRLTSVFKGEDGAAEVVIAFGVPVAERPASGPLPLALRTGIFVLDEAGRTMAETRSSPSSLPSAQIHALPQATLYIAAPTLAVPPGTYMLAVEFDAAAGSVAGYNRESLAVPDFTHGGLRLSDLLLAYHVEELEREEPVPGLIHRRGYEIAPAPWTVFSREQTLYLYFEAYGLHLGTDGLASYDVEVLLVPADERGSIQRLWDGVRGAQPEKGVSVAFESSGRGSDQGQYSIIDLTAQEPGEYVLSLRVQQGDRMVETYREITLW
ncbi:MAG: GWxTD domain-containing protein [Rhodothermales bacterium]